MKRIVFSLARTIVSAPQIIQLRLLIPHIPAIPERVQLCQRLICSCQVSHEHRFPPRIAPLFYHVLSCSVNDSPTLASEV